ncbi:hypothetical protein [Flavobacterium sp. UBA6135]|uniref:hypothetical protein n=1 Tax=Flavobacterium sp. UBA6135 TaxID=1946553 RepID=UPI0025BBB74D|nr:hypothetical protein [Flavobacterium sp. UBA6135]
MRQLTFTLTLIISTTFTACGQTKSKSNFEKIIIEIETVDFIEIKNTVGQSDTLKNHTKRLTYDQKKLFVEKFNSSKSNGLRKSISLYFIDVHFKDGTKRSFRINGKYIKENNDYSFDLGDSKLIETVWNELNVNHIKNIRYVFEDYIQYQESTDSQADKDLMTKSLKTLTTVIDKDDLDLLINVWMYYDPTDYPDIPEIFRILKDSRPHSIEAVKNRINIKKEWETDDSAPFSDLKNLLQRLENE